LQLFFVAVVSSNPAANTKWRWIPKRVLMDPRVKFLPSIPHPKPQQHRAPATKLVQVEGCGMAPLAPPTSKIVGGVEAAPHEFPWQVGLFIDDMYFCGGSVISEEWVMTAGHCMHNAKSVEVVLGAHNISTDEPSQVSLVSTDFFTHEDYNGVIVRNDIAMIHLPQKLTFNDYIQPVCLPTAPDLDAGVTVTPSGWGLLSDDSSSIADVVHKVDVPTTTNEICGEYYGAIVNENEICIDSTGGHGTCNGDSGGPLNHKVGPITETRGITSYGSSAGCESGAPDAFTRVTHYLDWIKTNTGVTR
jgi:secreted trypsin-like serine protease